MRNILISLTLCVLTLTTSSVFAEGYDASRRTERLGLSFYDGRPLYIIRFGCDVVDRKLTRADLIRVHTGSNLTDYGVPNGSGVVVDYVRNDAGKMYEYGYSFYGVDENGDLIPLHSATFGYPYYQEMLDSLIMRLSPDDVAVDIFDAMLEPLSEMLRGWIGVVLAIGAVMFGWNFIRELWTLDFSGKSKGKNGKTSAPLSYAKLSRRDRSLYEDAALGSIGIESSQLLVPKEIKKDVDFVTGAAFGLKFDEKTRESNRLLMEMFNRLSSKEQKAILKAFRESAYDKSFEDSAEKRFLAYQGEVFDDVDNPFTGRSKRRAFDPLDAEVLSQGYGSEYVGWDVVSSVDEIDDANASLDEAYYDDNGGTPF